MKKIENCHFTLSLFLSFQVTLSHGRPRFTFPLPSGIQQSSPMVAVEEDGLIRFQVNQVSEHSHCQFIVLMILHQKIRGPAHRCIFLCDRLTVQDMYDSFGPLYLLISRKLVILLNVSLVCAAQKEICLYEWFLHEGQSLLHSVKSLRFLSGQELNDQCQFDWLMS